MLETPMQTAPVGALVPKEAGRVGDVRGKRDPRLDVLKAVAIGLVVLGHVIRAAYGDATAAPLPLAAVFSVLSILDVPLFVFISGYLASPTAGAPWLGRRALQLLVPYASWIALRWLFFYRTDGLGWLWRSVVWGNETNALWFLYALFAVCAIYVALRRSRATLLGVAVLAAFIVPGYFSLRYIAMLFPVFVAGRLIGERRFEPGPWVLAVTAALLAVMWSIPGANLLFSSPGWADGILSGVGLSAWAAGAVVAALRVALMVALSLSAMYLARGATRGAWLGALTLGVYAAHPMLVPAWSRGAGLAGLVGGYVITASAAVGVTLLLKRWPWTCFLFLGSGDVPRRVGSDPDRWGDCA